MKLAAILLAPAIGGALLLAPSRLLAAERVLVSAQASGAIPSESETTLLLRRHRGEIRVRVGTAGEIRYASVRGQPRSAALPVEVWRDGGRLEIAPPEGAEPEAGILEVAVPPRIFVEVDSADASVTATGLRAGFEARGERLEVKARAIEGGVRLAVTTGRAFVDGSLGELSLTGSGLEVRGSKLEGPLRAKLSDSSLDIREVTGSLDADLRTSTLILGGLAGPLRLRASGGTAKLGSLQQGGEIVVSGTPLDLRESRGDIDIQTDADLMFRDTQADLHVDGYGGSVRGAGNEGLLEVRTEGAEVAVERIQGPVRVQGRRLTVDLKSVDGEVFVEAVSSKVGVAGAGAEVEILSENGDVSVVRPATDVTIDSRGGDVQVLETRGPFRIHADGSRVEVSLAAPFALKDSEVLNPGGEVELRIPPNLSVSIAAETRYGRIDSTLPGFGVQVQGKTAQGAVGPGGGQATIRIQAGGNIVLGEQAPARQ